MGKRKKWSVGAAPSEDENGECDTIKVRLAKGGRCSLVLRTLPFVAFTVIDWVL
jgi:hypothetical protein